MTNEPAHTALRMVQNAIKVILHQNASPNREVIIMLCFQLCSAHYTVLKMKNSTRSMSAINPVAMENTGDKHNHTVQ